jgi:hypothetical protein
MGKPLAPGVGIPTRTESGLTSSTGTARTGTPRRHLHRLPARRKKPRIWPWVLGIVLVCCS